MTKEYDNYEEMSSETEQEEYDEEYDENLPQYDENGNRYQDPEDQLPANPYERSSVYEGYSDLNKSQEETRYLLEPNDIPDNIKELLWGISSRHLELINIPDKADLKNYNRAINRIIRMAGWTKAAKKLSPSDVEQIRFYSQMIMLPKSLGRGERTLIATTINRSESDYSERPMGSVGTKPGVISTLKESLGGLFRG